MQHQKGLMKLYFFGCSHIRISLHMMPDMKVTALNSSAGRFDDRLKTLRSGEEDEAVQHTKYSSWKLKEKLLLHYKHRLVFVERAGKSDLVCSESVPMGLAMRAVQLEDKPEETTASPADCETQQQSQGLSDRHTLHRAADVLRKSMEQVDHDHKSYVSSDRRSRLHCSNYVPNNVYDFVNWCVDSNAHRNCETCDEEPALKDNLRVIAICHDLIAQCRHIHTPITLGLAILIHHPFGSKSLINELSATGHCVSYTEVRQFLICGSRPDIKYREWCLHPNWPHWSH
ncbi:hypothetical protein CgunFtcFv8_022866 [Champsocephalus gunnari]|uniref:Uncharacterized protein n=1 Tax=Champsocephalus gunnari TaxID=52237 RepID=A0AAN8DJA2_CHAGU|nr:hypothetical protein CgunFtcFv8_022866 [Champsocephalus gunnari]